MQAILKTPLDAPLEGIWQPALARDHDDPQCIVDVENRGRVGIERSTEAVRVLSRPCPEPIPRPFVAPHVTEELHLVGHFEQLEVVPVFQRLPPADRGE